VCTALFSYDCIYSSKVAVTFSIDKRCLLGGSQNQRMTPSPEEIPSVQKGGNIVKCHLLSDANFIAILASDRNEKKSYRQVKDIADLHSEENLGIYRPT
jgi:hypothetical protein